MNTDLLTLFDADEATMRKHVAEALSGSDDGELFIEHARALASSMSKPSRSQAC